MSASAPTRNVRTRSKCAAVLFGPPGSGKTTIVRALNVKQPLTVIETGNLLEREIRLRTAIGKRIKHDKAAGKLVPTDVVKMVIQARLKKVKTGWVLFDGFPRHLGQAEVFFELLETQRLNLCLVGILTLKLATALKRIAGRRVCPECGRLYNLQMNPPSKVGTCDGCGGKLELRADDQPATIRRRFATYRRETQPVIRRFKRDYPDCCWEAPETSGSIELATQLSERLDSLREGGAPKTRRPGN